MHFAGSCHITLLHQQELKSSNHSPQYRVVINTQNNMFMSNRILIPYTIRGLTGLVLSNLSIDIVVNGTYYTVVHFRYFSSLRAIFAIIARFIQLFSVFTGLTANPK